MDWEKLLKTLGTQNWIILMILGSISFFLMSSSFTLGVILGGLVIIANFGMLQRTIRSALFVEGVMKAGKRAIVAKYYFRLAILGIIIYTLITSIKVDPVGLVIGLSIVVLSIFGLGVRSIWKALSGEAI